MLARNRTKGVGQREPLHEESSLDSRHIRSGRIAAAGGWRPGNSKVLISEYVLPNAKNRPKDFDKERRRAILKRTRNSRLNRQLASVQNYNSDLVPELP